MAIIIPTKNIHSIISNPKVIKNEISGANVSLNFSDTDYSEVTLLNEKQTKSPTMGSWDYKDLLVGNTIESTFGLGIWNSPLASKSARHYYEDGTPGQIENRNFAGFGYGSNIEYKRVGICLHYKSFSFQFPFIIDAKLLRDNIRRTITVKCAPTKKFNISTSFSNLEYRTVSGEKRFYGTIGDIKISSKISESSAMVDVPTLTNSAKYSAGYGGSTFGKEISLDLTNKNAESKPTKITLSDDKKYYTITFKLIVGVSLYNLEGTGTTSDSTLNCSGTLTEYVPYSVEFDIKGNTYDIDFNGEDKLSIGTDTMDMLLIEPNSYLQKNDDDQILTEFSKTVQQYKNGKETATILCSIGDYYDGNGDIVISKNGIADRMCFSLYDEVVPSIRDSQGYDVPMSLLPSGNAKTFSVLGSRIYYDGAIWQEISLQEKGWLSLGNGTIGLAYELSADKTHYICSGIGESQATEIDISSKFGLYLHKIAVTEIKRGAFLNQDKLTKVIIPESIKTIGYEAFYDCDNLTTVNIPNSVTSLNGKAFGNCNLDEIVIPGNITGFGDSVFYNCTSLRTVIIKRGLTQIGSTAFQYCSSLTTIYIPKSVKILGANSLQGCTSLADIYYGGSSSDWNKVAKGFNSSIISNATIHYDYLLGSEGLKYELVDNTYSCVGIGDCTETDIDIASEIEGLSVTSIKIGAFRTNTSITSVVIPKSVTSIGIYAFYKCSSLRSATIGNGVTSIGTQVFDDCSSLTSVEIPNSVTSIGNYAFRNCTSLKDVYYAGTEAQWNSIVKGSSNEALTNATIHYNYS